MKKVFITLGVLILVVITALMVIPTFFKGDILQIIEKQSAKYINAKLKIGDMNLSMFKSFPNLNVALKEVMITGQDEFAGDTVVYIPLFEASVNLKSLIAGDELIVNQLLLKNCRIAPTVNSEGKANWDILLSSGSQTSATTETPPDEPKGKAERGLRLNDIAIEIYSSLTMIFSIRLMPALQISI